MRVKVVLGIRGPCNRVKVPVLFGNAIECRLEFPVPPESSTKIIP
ncbi:hypothetical protein [Methanosarcina sp.]|nr:hypothetical protein [Methanosarcina sp.]MDW5550098.1 hypothetical protein [Methanosarcina sp.]